MIGSNVDVTETSAPLSPQDHIYYCGVNMCENLDYDARTQYSIIIRDLQFTSDLGGREKNWLFYTVYYPAKFDKKLESFPGNGMNIVLDILFLKNFFHVPAYRFLSDRDRYVLSPWILVNHLMGNRASLFNISWKGIREQD